MAIRWSAFYIDFRKWIRSNTFQPLDPDKTLLVMRASMFRSAPFDVQPVFEKLFGPIDPDKLIPDMKSKCAELRKIYRIKLQTGFIPMIDPVIAEKAIRLTNQQIGLSHIYEPATAEQALMRLPSSTSSGAPNYITPKSEDSLNALTYVNDVMLGKEFLPKPAEFWPVTLVWRTQMRSSGVKARIIAAFPQVVSILEMRFALPFFQQFESTTGRTWYSYACTWVENSNLWEFFRDTFNDVIEIDYEAFDQSVPGTLIYLFYENLKSFLKLDGLDLYLFNWIRDYHMHAQILNSEDGQPSVIKGKLSGVLSGSVFTNFIDTWINLFVLNYCMIASGREDSPYYANAMGDDIVLGVNENGNTVLNAISKCASSVFGMKVGNKSKVVKAGEPFFYMGYLLNNRFKLAKEQLLKDKMTVTGRFIPEDDLPNKMVVWSKFCSICSTCSNGYDFWLKWKTPLLRELGMEQPNYFHDLTEGPRKPFDINRIITDAEEYVKTAWAYT